MKYSFLEFLKLRFMQFLACFQRTEPKPTPGLYRNLDESQKILLCVRLTELKTAIPKFTMQDITKILNYEFNIRNTPSSYNTLWSKIRTTPIQGIIHEDL